MDSQDKQTGFILGAGFSMAVSKSMPNMKMLFKGIIEILYGYATVLGVNCSGA